MLMEKLVPILLCTVFIFIAYLLAKLTLKINALIIKKKVFSRGRGSSEAITLLLSAELGESHVISGRYLPLTEDGGKTYIRADNIAVLPGGVVFIRVKTLSGYISSNDGYVWHQSLRLKTGEIREQDFPSPIYENQRSIAAAAELFSRAHIPCPPIYGLVIFSSNNVNFSAPQKEVCSLRDGLERLSEISKKKKLTHKERLIILRTVRRYSAKSADIRAYNKKHGINR